LQALSRFSFSFEFQFKVDRELESPPFKPTRIATRPGLTSDDFEAAGGRAMNEANGRFTRVQSRSYPRRT
jgi:hypothetical protein